MRRPESGFTLFELLMVIVVISLVVSVFGGHRWAVFGSQSAANVTADALNLRWHNQQLELYKLKNKGGLPMQGGHKFVLATWEVVDQAEENFDRYFTPRRRDNDPDYRKGRAMVERGEDPWPELGKTTSLDTHYAGRAREHPLSARNEEDEAVMADDNEGVWSHADGTVNVLFKSGIVRTYSYRDLKNRGYVEGEFDKNKPIETTGPDSPIPECRKLAR